MPVCGNFTVDGPAQLEVFYNHARTQVERLAYDTGKIVVIKYTGVVGINGNRKRLGYAYRITYLHLRAGSKVSGYDIFCYIARGIRCRAVYFRWVFSRKGTTSMRAHAPVGIYNNFPTRKARITVRTPDNKSPGGIYQYFCFFGEQ